GTARQRYARRDTGQLLGQVQPDHVVRRVDGTDAVFGDQAGQGVGEGRVVDQGQPRPILIVGARRIVGQGGRADGAAPLGGGPRPVLGPARIAGRKDQNSFAQDSNPRWSTLRVVDRG